MNQGQACESGSRLFLHKDIHDEFLKALKTEFESIRVGDPLILIHKWVHKLVKIKWIPS